MNLPCARRTAEKNRKMEYKQILQNEDSNLDKVYLYPEGLFLKAYERSAYAVSIHIHPFKPSKRYIKIVDRMVISVGFPSFTLGKWFKDYICEELPNGVIACYFDETIDVDSFITWKESIPTNAERCYTQHTAGIEKLPLFKVCYDLVIQVCTFSVNIPKDMRVPIGDGLKQKVYDLCLLTTVILNTRDDKTSFEKATQLTSDIKLCLRLLKDMKAVSLAEYSLASERIVSVSKQLFSLQR